MRGGNAENAVIAVIAVIAENGDETAALGSLLFEEATSRFVISGSEGYNPAFSQNIFWSKTAD